jgi:hypothetical protein
MINQDIIAQDLFYKIRSRFPKMEMGNEQGQSTFEASKGRFFDFDAIFNENNLGTVSISINEPGSLKLYFNKNILEDSDELTSKTWYSFLREMRKFAMKRLMSFDTRDISKTNLDKRDYGYLANKGPVMSESMMRGTSRTSYRPLEALQRTRLIIRHSKPVDESIPGARSRNLESLFVENAAGERFKYPFKHLAGAKAMQRHVANEGYPHDTIGKKIIQMSEDMAKLANFKHYVYREDLMNKETNHIVGRANAKLQQLKEKINKISMQHHYEAFKSDCDMGLSKEQPLIDEITLEEYKDKFTVKSFKEDIADVFPILYSIMQEDDLDLEAVAQVEDQTKDLDLAAIVAESPESQFDEWASTLVETRLTPEDLSALNALLSEHFPVGINGDNVTGSLEELGIEVPDATKMQLAQLAEQAGPDADAVSVVVEFLSKFQPEIYGALDVQQPVQEAGKGILDFVKSGLSAADQHLLKTARSEEARNMQLWNKRYPNEPWPPQSDDVLLKAHNHDLNVQKANRQQQMTDVPNTYSPIGQARAEKQKLANIDAQNNMRSNKEVLDKAYGIDEANTTENMEQTNEGGAGIIDTVKSVGRKAGDIAGKVATSVALNPISRIAAAGVGLGANAVYQSNKEKEEAEAKGTQPATKTEPTKEEMGDQTPEEKRHAMEYLQKVARAIKSGEVQPEEIESEFFNTLPMLGVSDEKTMTAWDRITGSNDAPKRPAMSDADIDAELRGIKGGDEEDDAQFISNLRNKAKSGSIGQDTTGFGSEVDESEESKKSGMKDIAEFIMGFYDRNTGNFPLGETGVKIKVEKEFGEKAGSLAERLIQKLASQTHEAQLFEDIKVLSGQVKRDRTLVAINKSPQRNTSQVNESIEFGDLKKLAGIGTKSKITGKTSEVLDLKKLAGL